MTLPLLHSPADVLRWLMVSLSLGSDPTPWAGGSGNAWPIFCVSEPTEPDNCLTVKDTQGHDDGRTMHSELEQHWGIQVRIRSIDEPTGVAKAYAIRQVLSEEVLSAPVTMVNPDATYLVYNCASFGSVLPLGKDVPRSKRSLFTINLTAVIRRTA